MPGLHCLSLNAPMGIKPSPFMVPVMIAALILGTWFLASFTGHLGISDSAGKDPRPVSFDRRARNTSIV
ncbi:MAG: hypothetical protein ACUVQV_07525 [Dissulfurimicrobium sp.]|uniref:hypothetical protein n=1 Tax=Dissulfurimicrobium sp. TaxID=2022436 RepID=UPI004049E680